jgi:pimeloyl-ACP methyl ester carboxylesterase
VTAPRDLEVAIPADGAILAGTLSMPAGPDAPGVLLIGGTFSDLRDGDADPRDRPDIPPHGMYRVLSQAIVAAGLAVLRIDRRGSGASTGSRPDRATEIADAAAAWGWLGTADGVAGAAAMVGESAGAYVVCRLAAAGHAPRAAVLQGALHRSIRDLIAFNGHRSRALYEAGPEERAWLWEHARHEYASALLVPAMLEALDRGDLGAVTAADERGRFERSLVGLDYDIEHAPGDQFAAITCPALVLHGGDDLNVPVEDAFATVRSLWAAGNRRVDLVILAGSDHSMQLTPPDPAERVRERVSFGSFHRPFHPRYGETVARFLRDALEVT